MIHVAPCSCELHARIRELEAELQDSEERTKQARVMGRDHMARAEKAEATLREKIAVGLEWFQRMTDAEARVAELEEALAHASPSGETPLLYPNWAKKLDDEREAD